MFADDPLQILGSLGQTSRVVLAVLLLLSIVSWGIILSKWCQLRRIKKEDRCFLNVYYEKSLSDKYDLQDLQRIAITLPRSSIGAVFLGLVGRMGLLVDDSDITRTSRQESPLPHRDYVQNVMLHLVQKQIIRQESYLPFLATTGNLSPFIGLLGTVVGVINAFQQIGMEGSANIAAVAPGVAEALIATAAGLFAAIPAVVGYNYYLAKIRKIVFGVETFGVELLNALEGMVPTIIQSKRIP